jgi:choline dehydrogenase-like flavoprotein
VVDKSLRVFGVEGLRVLDCSIMPTIVSANTNAAAMVIAHKGIEMLMSRSHRGRRQLWPPPSGPPDSPRSLVAVAFFKFDAVVGRCFL